MIRLRNLIPMWLHETGEGTAKPYGYKKTYSGGTMDEWGFTTDSGVAYTVMLSHNKRTLTAKKTKVEWYIDFSIDPDTAGPSSRMSRYGDTNRGELYRVMATVVAVLRNELNRAGQPDEIRWAAEPKRSRLYTQYIRRAFPKAKVVDGGSGEVVIKLKP